MRRSFQTPRPARVALTLAALTALFATPAAVAQAPPAEAAKATPTDRARAEKISARLVTDVVAVSPGGRFGVGILFELDPEWHVYWKYAGDTGLATNITFGAPDGFDFDYLSWPAPSRFVDKLGGISYGHEDAVLIYTEVTALDDLVEGAQITLTADATWLVCKENCINGKASLSLSLPVQVGERAALRSPDAALFDRFAARVPRDAPAGVTVVSQLDREGVRPGEAFTVSVVVHDAEGAAITAVGEDGADSFMPHPERGLNVTAVRVDPDAADVPPGGLALRVEGRASHTPTATGARIAGALIVNRDGAPLVIDTALEVPRLPPDAAAAVPPPTPGEAAVAPIVAGDVTFAEVCDHALADAAAEGPVGDGKLASFWLALLFAFIGGLVLNVMPCVLPVLSLKVMSLVEQSGQDRRVIWRHGLAYTSGVLVSFAVFGAILIGLSISTWAFQMQDPLFVAIFGAVVFAMALSLFGVFEITLPGATRIEGQVARSHGYMSSFNYGVFAVLLGTPCTAPLLGPAMAYAFTQPPFELMVLMLTVGFGLASPFLLLAAFPQWQRLLPKPGGWLITFKKIMAFLLVGTALYLVYALSGQVSRDALIGYLAFLTVMSLGLWIWGHWGSPMRSRGSRWAAAGVTVVFILGAGDLFLSTEPPPARQGTLVAGGITWHDFDQIDVRQAASDGHTVFIDFTADWCATCKVNEGTAIYTDAVRQAIATLNVMPVKADFTIAKPEISKWLEEFDEPSVPLYVVLPAGRPEAAIKLPTILSTADVVRGLCQAGPSTVPTAAL